MPTFKDWFGRGDKPAEPTAEERQYFGGIIGAGYYGGAPIYQSQASGLYVDQTDGLRSLAAVWGSIRLITQRLSSLPRRVIDADGNVLPKPDWIEKPNDYSTGTDVISQMIVSLLIDGNAFIIREIDAMGMVSGFHCPHPAQVEVLLLQEPHGLTYWFVGTEVPDEAIQHAKYIAPPGFIRGISPLDSLREQVEIGQASQAYQKNNLTSGAAIQYAVTTKAALKPDERKALRAQMMAKHHSPKNAQAPMIFSGDMSITPLSITPQQLEFINQSKMTDVIIVSMGFGIDPTIMGIQQSGSQLTYQSSDQRERQLWLDCLKPVAKLVEECISNLLPDGEFFDIDESELMYGSHKDRIEGAQKLADANAKNPKPFATIDEIRAALNLPPLTAQQMLELEQMKPAETMPTEMDDDEMGEMMDGMMTDEGDA